MNTLSTAVTTGSTESAWDYSTENTTDPIEESTTPFPKSEYCYPLVAYPSDDTLVYVFFLIFLILLLTSIIWRIASGILMIRRYQSKIKMLSDGPVLDASYFDGAPAQTAKPDAASATPIPKK